VIQILNNVLSLFYSYTECLLLRSRLVLCKFSIGVEIGKLWDFYIEDMFVGKGFSHCRLHFMYWFWCWI